MRAYVYQIVGPTGVYIGKANDPDRRWADHAKESRRGAQYRLYRAMRKYGPEWFWPEVVACCVSEESAFAAEREIVRQLLAAGVRLYNMTDGGEGGLNPAPETRERQRQARLGSKHSPETRAKMSQARLGHAVSAETREKIRQAVRGNKNCLGHKNAFGHKRSAEARERTRQAMLGNKHSLGHKHSPETIEKRKQACRRLSTPLDTDSSVSDRTQEVTCLTA